MKPHHNKGLLRQKGNILCLIVLLVFTSVITSSAQKIMWTDSFTQGQTATAAQCENWSNFLATLSGQSFVAVTISGSFDPTGITLNDPVAATELARLLNSGTEGTVVSGGYSWIVSVGCGGGNCVAQGIALAVEIGSVSTTACNCEGKYAIRPHLGKNANNTENGNWGGINTSTCFGPSQTMKLEFKPQVYITSVGDLCEGGKLQLTANVENCNGPYKYLWNNGATTQTLDVTNAGNYTVTVTGENCSGRSEISVTGITTTVNAGADVTFCDTPVQLSAFGESGGTTTPPLVNKYCMFSLRGCVFTNNLCNDASYPITNSLFSRSVTVPASNPGDLRFLMYYSTYSGKSTFTFKLNNAQIGSFVETVVSATCTPGTAGQYPKTFGFTQSQFKQFWKSSETNLLTVEIVSEGSLRLAGIVAEVVVPTESYSWSPALGLSNASIQNPVANPAVETLYKVKYTAANGCFATDEILVKVGCNIAIPCKPLAIVAAENCQATAEARELFGGVILGGETFTVAPVGPYPVGVTKVTLTVIDAKGNKGTCETTVTVTDTALPEFVNLVDLSFPNDPGVCSATVELKQPDVKDNCGIKSISNDRTSLVFPEGETIVNWTVTDVHDNIRKAAQKITIENVAPVIMSIEASAGTVAVNSAVSLNIAYTDNNVTTATIDWDDNSAIQTVTNPKDIFAASHKYNNAGLYSVTVKLTDACELSVSYVYDYIVVYDVNAGFVTGGGWYNSPKGAYLSKPSASGKATFEFEIKYKKRGGVPEGKTEFQFNAGELKFKSSDYEWLVVEDNAAVFKGSGKVNGKSGYGILISVVDEDAIKSSKKSKKADRIRVKITTESGSVFYDTQVGAGDGSEALTKIGGGSIKIHNRKSDQYQNDDDDNERDDIMASSDEASTNVYPNPFTQVVTVRYYSASNENLQMQVTDITGKPVYDRSHDHRQDGAYTLDFGNDEGEPGLYILKISQGVKTEFIKIIRN